MNWMRLSDSEAKKKIKDYESKPQDQFSEIVQNWKDGKFDLEDPEYSEIRTCIYSEYEKYKDKSGYEIDLRVGLALYNLFLEEKYKDDATLIYQELENLFRIRGDGLYLFFYNEDNKEEESEASLIYNVTAEDGNDNAPAWIKAVRDTAKNMI